MCRLIDCNICFVDQFFSFAIRCVDMSRWGENLSFFFIPSLLRRRAYRLYAPSVLTLIFPVFLRICIVELIRSSYIRFVVTSRHSIWILRFTILPPLRLDYEMYIFLSKCLARSLAQSLLSINLFALEFNALTSLNAPQVTIFFKFYPCYVVRPIVVCALFSSFDP